MKVYFFFLILLHSDFCVAKNSVFNGHVIRLELTQKESMKMVLFSYPNTSVSIADLDVPSNGTIVTGKVRQDRQRNRLIHTLTIHQSEVILGHNVTLNSLEIQFEVTTNLKTGKWLLNSGQLKYSGSLRSTNFTAKNALLVTPKSGTTSSPADRICSKGYTICAPIHLCWTCDSQEIKTNVTQVLDSEIIAKLIIPGMKLQPFYGNETSFPKFGYEWDCDPLISIGLWQGLLLTIFFGVIVIWAISYLASIGTPDRFGNPREPEILTTVTRGD